mmetsp:Transcript_25738/g.31113  ORF Transcript_25738/g.31113 Transcript_25738/m.31113 type:complete len:91 (+) Transcript_25738:110-382(+)
MSRLIKYLCDKEERYNVHSPSWDDSVLSPEELRFSLTLWQDHCHIHLLDFCDGCYGDKSIEIAIQCRHGGKLSLTAMKWRGMGMRPPTWH